MIFSIKVPITLYLFFLPKRFSICFDDFLHASIKRTHKYFHNISVRSKPNFIFQSQTYLQDTVFIAKICHSTFSQQIASPNGSIITSTCPMTLLKTCRVFFRVQKSECNAFRNFLKPFRELFWSLKNQSPYAGLKYVEIST